MRKIFRNQFGHFRAGWRILNFLGMAILCFTPVAGLLKLWDLISPRNGGSSGPEEITSLVNIVFYLGLNLSIVLGSWLSLRWIDKRPYAILGLDFNLASVKDFAKGFFLGFLNFLIIFIVLKLSGLIEINISILNAALFTGILKYLIFFTVAAFFEEVLNRGYIFQALIEGIGKWTAVIIIALVFVIGHVMNTGFALNSAVFFFVHAILYCMLYLLTRSIWVPFGFHLAWNWFQGSIFGINVSGTEIKNTLFLCEPDGPGFLSGGEFGIEGSLISSVISIFFILFLIKSRWLKPDPIRLTLWHKYSKTNQKKKGDDA